MRSNTRTRVLSRLAVTLAATAPLVLLTAIPASASAPSNDDITNATVITSLPFNDTVDMSQATFAATDVSFCGGNAASVWYTFTPSISERVAFDPGPSNAAIAIDVFTGSPGALSPVGCGQGCNCDDEGGGGFILSATADTTYWIMTSTAFTFGGTPTLGLWVYLDVPPQATVSVNGGTVDRAGNAKITGTFDCIGTVPGGAPLAGNVTQPVGRQKSVTATFATTTTCARAQPWTALAQPSAGKFASGAATVNVAPPESFSICNLAGCTDPNATAVIKLKG
jgi:hypothetical protein